jgi:hypothetical protein
VRAESEQLGEAIIGQQNSIPMLGNKSGYTLTIQRTRFFLGNLTGYLASLECLIMQMSQLVIISRFYFRLN